METKSSGLLLLWYMKTCHFLCVDSLKKRINLRYMLTFAFPLH